MTLQPDQRIQIGIGGSRLIRPNNTKLFLPFRWMWNSVCSSTISRRLNKPWFWFNHVRLTRTHLQFGRILFELRGPLLLVEAKLICSVLLFKTFRALKKAYSNYTGPAVTLCSPTRTIRTVSFPTICWNKTLKVIWHCREKVLSFFFRIVWISNYFCWHTWFGLW